MVQKKQSIFFKGIVPYFSFKLPPFMLVNSFLLFNNTLYVYVIFNTDVIDSINIKLTNLKHLFELFEFMNNDNYCVVIRICNSSRRLISF